MAALPHGTIWLASYPKSGNTWMRMLFANLLAGGDAPVDINNLPGTEDIATSRSPFEEQTAVDSTLLTLEEVERLRAAVHDGQAEERTQAAVIKMHDAYVRLVDGIPFFGRSARAALYLVRDPRDVAVSLSFHNNISLAAVVSQMNDPKLVIQRAPFQVDYRALDWSNHVLSWLDQHDVPVHLVNYENLLADTAGTFSRALAFLDAHWTGDELARAIRHASFAEMQHQEAEKGFRERMSRDAPFFRSGKSGGWREQMADVLVRQIEQAHGAVMDRLGYTREIVT